MPFTVCVMPGPAALIFMRPRKEMADTPSMPTRAGPRVGNDAGHSMAVLNGYEEEWSRVQQGIAERDGGAVDKRQLPMPFQSEAQLWAHVFPAHPYQFPEAEYKTHACTR